MSDGQIAVLTVVGVINVLALGFALVRWLKNKYVQAQSWWHSSTERIVTVPMAQSPDLDYYIGTGHIQLEKGQLHGVEILKYWRGNTPLGYKTNTIPPQTVVYSGPHLRPVSADVFEDHLLGMVSIIPYEPPKMIEAKKEKQQDNQPKQQNNNGQSNGKKVLPNDQAQKFVDEERLFDKEPKFAVNKPYRIIHIDLPGDPDDDKWKVIRLGKRN
jgi:hypothetical protein